MAKPRSASSTLRWIGQPGIVWNVYKRIQTIPTRGVTPLSYERLYKLDAARKIRELLDRYGVRYVGIDDRRTNRGNVPCTIYLPRVSSVYAGAIEDEAFLEEFHITAMHLSDAIIAAYPNFDERSNLGKWVRRKYLDRVFEIQ